MNSRPHDTRAGNPPFLRLLDVEKWYGSDCALCGVSLDVEATAAVAIAGPSGCGKSTLLYLLGSMERPDHGRVFVGGRDLSALSDGAASRFRRQEVGFVFQFFNLIATLTVLDNVALPARLSGEDAATARERAGRLLGEVALGDRAHAYPDSLSGGQQQRVAVARALVNGPRLVLADEPTGALDSHSGRDVLELLIGLVENHGATLVMATHSEEAMRFTGRIVHLEDGRVTGDSAQPKAGERA